MGGKIIDKRKDRKYNVEDLNYGEFFIFEEQLYIRIPTVRFLYNALRLQDGRIMQPTGKVEKVDVEISIIDKEN